METYPIIIVPKSLEEISKSQPYDNVSKPDYDPPKKPKMPFELWQEEMEKEELNKPSVGIRLVQIFIAVPFLVFVGGFALFWPLFMMEDKIAFMVLNIFMFVIVYVYIYHTDEIRSIKEEYEKEIAEYENGLKTYKREYENKLNSYKREQLRIHKMKESNGYLKKLKSHRRQLFDQFVNNVEKPTLQVENNVNGKSESYFLKYLKKYFNGFIKTNLTIEHEYLDAQQSKGQVYVPDFIFMKKGLPIIDIEIDEPYTAESGVPIHYITADDIRNSFFINKNWMIIRFAEEQIIKEPDKCCYLIANAVYEYSNDETFINKFDSFEYPIEKGRWHLSDAMHLAEKKYRNTYLP